MQTPRKNSTVSMQHDGYTAATLSRQKKEVPAPPDVSSALVHIGQLLFYLFIACFFFLTTG